MSLTKEQLAEKLFDAACVAQSKRLKPNNPNPNPRDVACEFKDLMDSPKDHYLAMAEWVLCNMRAN